MSYGRPWRVSVLFGRLGVPLSLQVLSKIGAQMVRYIGQSSPVQGDICFPWGPRPVACR